MVPIPAHLLCLQKAIFIISLGKKDKGSNMQHRIVIFIAIFFSQLSLSVAFCVVITLLNRIGASTLCFIR